MLPAFDNAMVHGFVSVFYISVVPNIAKRLNAKQRTINRAAECIVEE
jgi:hypothetical protein